MKTVFTLAIGIWIGRQVYINYDHKQALRREMKIKKKLLHFFKENGLDAKQAGLKVKQLWDAEPINN